MTLVAGITGGLNTGKSTVASFFIELGAKGLNADAVVHRLLDEEGACFQAVVKKFGTGILSEGRIDRKKLGAVVFGDFQKLEQLTSIVHPLVKKELLEEIERYKKNFPDGVVVVDVPLLFESGFYRKVDVTVVVKARQQDQLKRAVKSLGITQAEARRRMKAQWPLKEKIRLADMIIDNSGSILKTKKEVKTLWRKLVQMAKR